MRRSWIAILTVFVLGAPQGYAREATPGHGSLSDRLDAVLDQPSLRRARVSALVVRDSDGAVLYAHSPDEPLIPASNLKILTAIAALDAFGPAHRFETRVLAGSPPDESGAVQDLFVVGGGDPVLNSEDWWQLAGELRRLGIRRVKGDIVVDDGVLDSERWHPSWGKTSSRAYHAPVGGLTANYGAFSVTVVPGTKQGEPVEIAVDPPVPYLRVANRAVTGSSRSRQTLEVDRKSGVESEWVTVEGSVRAGTEPFVLRRSVLDPLGYAAAVFRWQLEANGIAVMGGTRRGLPPKNAVELLVFKGRSVAEVVRLFVKFSNNAVAETLVKSLGVHDRGNGDWSDGVEALRSRLRDFGLEEDGLVITDGSGLSYSNRLSARTVVSALRLANASFRVGPELKAALPRAGEDGTLKRRASRGRDVVRAKTGLLNQVTALSGYAELPSGGWVTFSILVNGYRGSDEAAMEAVDQFVGELVDPPRRHPRLRKFGR